MRWTFVGNQHFVSLDFAGHLLLGATQLAVSNVLENLFEKILVTFQIFHQPVSTTQLRGFGLIKHIMLGNT
jgi:hypothetical protein